MKRVFILIFWLFSLQVLSADPLDEYIQLGLKNNLALKQKDFNYQESIHALKEARGLFLPSLSIEARYTRAGGGREIEFPVGDLLNPVYATLNQLTGTASFPQLGNERIPFLREKEHETKLRLVQPLFQYSIYANYSLKEELQEASLEELSLYRQELVKDISKAYYQYIQTRKIKELYNGTLELVTESVRVSQALFDNEMVTQDAIFRSKAEKLKTEQQLALANKRYILARSYFNFLLNRPLETPIEIEEAITHPLKVPNLADSEQQALNQRKEISQLNYAINASKSAVDLASSGYYPGFNLVVDYGFQGAEYNFTRDNDYWMASAVFSWNLFNGFQDSEKKQQARIQYKILQTQMMELKQNIRLQVKNAFHTLETDHRNYEASKMQQTYNDEAYKIISKKYDQGLASQIELIDARVNMTNSQIGTVVNYYNYLISYVEFQQLTGALTLENQESDL